MCKIIELLHFQKSLFENTSSFEHLRNEKPQTLGGTIHDTVTSDMRRISDSLTKTLPTNDREYLKTKVDEKLVHNLKKELHRKEKIISRLVKL